MKILILYTEIAQYVTASLRFFLQQNPSYEVHLIRYPVNTEAPFEFKSENNLHLYTRQDFDKKTLLEFASKLMPDAILCSGWIDKEYPSVCRMFQKKIPVILIMDNHWNGSLKQRILSVAAPLSIHRTFNKVWVPGLPQKEYALKLGFKEEQIKTGYYCGDIEHFGSFYQENKFDKSNKFQKRFICVARYIPVKGLETLWNAFIELKNEGKLIDWELWCLGTGENFNKRTEHKDIKHFGFIQPNDMTDYIKKTSFFVLPSLFEPWGVVVHEFAAAGFPLLLSSAVGSGSAFLEEGKNGFTFPPSNKEVLKEKMNLIAAIDQNKFNSMSEHSVLLAEKINPQNWTRTLLDFIVK